MYAVGRACTGSWCKWSRISNFLYCFYCKWYSSCKFRCSQCLAYISNHFIYKLCKHFICNTGQKVPMFIDFNFYVISCMSDSVFTISFHLLIFQVSASPDQFSALGKILVGTPLHRSQFHDQFSHTHTETACIYSILYLF